MLLCALCRHDQLTFVMEATCGRHSPAALSLNDTEICHLGEEACVTSQADVNTQIFNKQMGRFEVVMLAAAPPPNMILVCSLWDAVMERTFQEIVGVNTFLK